MASLSERVISNLLDQVEELQASSTTKPTGGDLGKLSYFPLMAKGLQPAICAELSGLAWEGNPVELAEWKSMKASGVCPFGQMPILQVGDLTIGQSTAICNFIGRKGNMLGASDAECAQSDMCMAEGEDLYAAMQKYQDTLFVKDKVGQEELDEFWSVKVPQHFSFCDKLSFTPSGTTVGEVYLFGMIYQMSLCRKDILKNSFPNLQTWFTKVSGLPAVQKVLNGESKMGKLVQYFQTK